MVVVHLVVLLHLVMVLRKHQLVQMVYLDKEELRLLPEPTIIMVLEVAEEVSMVVELVQAIVTVQIIEHIMAVVLDMCIHPILLLIIHQGAY
jgi:ABC-type branched-subunit amino acid transport system ATPase component